MVPLGGLGQENNLIFKNIEKPRTDQKELHFPFGRCNGKPAGLKGSNEGGVIDQNPETSIAPGSHDRSNRAVKKDPVRCNDGEMKCFFSHVCIRYSLNVKRTGDDWIAFTFNE